MIRYAIAIAAIFTLTGCSWTQKVANDVSVFVDKNCKCEEKKEIITGQPYTKCVCDSLYEAQKVYDKCKVASITFDASKARITARVNCKDGQQDILDAVKQFIGGVIKKYKSSKK